jgi:hypothetical protein
MREILKLHPHSHRPDAANVEARITRPRGGALDLTYIVRGKMADLILPPAVASARADELWRRTCFEAFAGPVAGSPYYELNFAPSTEWAAYRFDDYRVGMAIATDIAPPRIGVRLSEKRLELQVSVMLDGASLLPEDAPWRVALSAVIEQRDGRISYWALAHPPGKPDFHHSDSFACTLSPERTA